VSAFVVPADRPGLNGEHLDMISPHPIGRLVFDGVPVRAGELLGERDRGFRVAMRTLRRGHLLEHLYREVRAPRIYEGASEVQRTIIARDLYR
jgi:alkylation response protein AidB-like acyl-CoA dehydrogenase